MIRNGSAIVAAMLAIAAAAGAVRAQDESLEAMQGKAATLEIQVRDLTAKIDIRLKRKKDDEEASRQEHQRILSARSDLERRKATMLAAKAELEARCQGELPQAAFDRCSGELDSHNANARTLDNDIETHNLGAAAWEERNNERKKAADEEVEGLRSDQLAATRALMNKRQAISDRRVKDRQVWIKNCIEDCKRRSDDSAKHCEMQCFDNAARLQLTPTLGKERPELAPGLQQLESGVSRSTEAIRAYRDSGAERPGPQSFRTREVPPP